MPPPVPARKFFDTNNDASVCASYAIAWLTASMIRGEPLTNPGFIQNQGQIAKYYHGVGARGRVNFAARGSSAASAAKHVRLGGASARVLPASGLKIMNPDSSMLCSDDWTSIGDVLAQQEDGYFYLTLRSHAAPTSGYDAAHAMACIIDADNVWYLEPQRGLFRSPRATFPAWFAGNFAYFNLPAAGATFKYYRVEQLD